MTLREFPHGDKLQIKVEERNKMEKLQNVPLKEIKPTQLRVLVCVKRRVNLGLKPLPEDIKDECGFKRAKDATAYLRSLEREGLVKAERSKNVYTDVMLTEEGIQYLNNHLLIPYRDEVRKKILMIENNEVPEVRVDENIKNLVKILIPKITNRVHTFMLHEYSTVIPDNNLERISQEIQEFFSQEFNRFEI